jgi:curved DNA-binding protein CbpA
LLAKQLIPVSMNFTNYYRTLGLPDFSSMESAISSYEYSYKALQPKYEDDAPAPIEALDALKQAYNVLGDPEIKDSYDVALQDHLNLIREERNYYAILNIAEFTSLADINDGRFYEEMRFQPPDDHAEALKYVAEAYAVLADPEKKEKYDAELRLKHTSLEKTANP